jgi:hypothetical protein
MFGTSFSSPLTVGFAACILEQSPNLKGKPMKLKKLLEENSTLYPYFDLAHGYGELMPMEFKKKSISIHPSFDFSKNNNELIITPKTSNNTNAMLYWKLINDHGEIIHYSVVKIENSNPITISINNAKKLEVFFNGYYFQQNL